MYETVRTNTKKAESIINTARHWTKAWRDLYKNPSRSKEEIRDYWERELADVGAHIIGYMGNSMTFSIYAESDEAYYCITKSHNYKVMK